MTPTPPLSDPPFGAETAEAVSALLDGELAAFAADHGTTEADARARLEAWPGFEARRTALADARATVATSVPALDDVARRRLVRNASDARPAPATGTRGARVWKIVGAAAAALVLVVGVGLAIDAAGGGGSSSSSDSASSSAAESARPDLHGDLGDLGDLSGPDALRAILTGARDAKTPRRSSDDADRAPGGGGGCQSCSTFNQSGGPPAAASGQARALSGAPALPPDQCAAQLAGTRPVTFVGTGTYRGTAVTVIGLTEGGRVIAFLVPSNDCTAVLTSVSR